MGRWIALANQKGGVGKTTTAINLSAFLAKAGKNVLLVDIDPQGNASSGLGLDVHSLQKTIYEVLLGELSSVEAVVPSYIHFLDILPANVNLSGIEVDMLQMQEHEFMLKKALAQVAEQYDYILIDCPPNLGILTLNALCAAKEVIVILQTEYYALEGLTQLMKVIGLVQNSLNPELDLNGIVLTMYDQRTILAQQVASDVQSHFQGKVYSAIIPRNVKLSEAPSYGKFIGDYAAESSGALAYQKLSEELEARL